MQTLYTYAARIGRLLSVKHFSYNKYKFLCSGLAFVLYIVLVCSIITNAMELALSLNGSNTSLLYSAPTLTLPYISVISLASVIGTLGNLLVIGSLSGSVSRRNPRTVGKIFIVNLACSDMIVTSVINPVAVAGMLCDHGRYCRTGVQE